MPAMHLISVDLPAPLSPTSAMTSPERTSKSTSASACTEPNVFERSRISRSGVSLTAVFKKEAVEVRRPHLHHSPSWLVAELLELPGAHLAPLEETVPEETRVVRLGDRGHRDEEGELPLALVRARPVGRGLPALEQRDRSRSGRVRLVRHVLVDRVGLPAGDDVLDALDGRVLTGQRDGIEPLRLQRGDDRTCNVV